METEPDGQEPAAPMTRRHFLASVGAGVVAGGLGSVVLSGTPESPESDGPAGAVDRRADGISESELPYAVWQYHYDPDEPDDIAVASPVNVVFPLENATFADLTDTFGGAGWTGSPLEYTLWAWDRQEERYRRPHWSGAETYFGLGGRLHVRVWHFEGTASLQAHVDSAVVPRHEVTSYADARVAVETIFEDAGWEVDGSLDLANATPPDHDGAASVIRR